MPNQLAVIILRVCILFFLLVLIYYIFNYTKHNQRHQKFRYKTHQPVTVFTYHCPLDGLLHIELRRQAPETVVQTIRIGRN